jgi:hypothetical protein
MPSDRRGFPQPVRRLHPFGDRRRPCYPAAIAADEAGMSDDKSSAPALGPALGEEGERRREAQRQRLAEALRENLQKRKQQSRARLEATE